MALRAKLTDMSVLEKLEEGRVAVARRLIPHARVGTLGFCMGGGFALLAACRRRFGFAVDYYGRIEHAEDVGGLDGPVLCLLASEDERITPWAFSELLPAAMRMKKRVSVELYPGVRHGFHRPGRELYRRRCGGGRLATDPRVPRGDTGAPVDSRVSPARFCAENGVSVQPLVSAHGRRLEQR